jgi:hypothetical protein
VKNLLPEIKLIYSHRQLSVESAERTTNMEMELHNVSTKRDYSLKKLDGFDIQMKRQAGNIDVNSSLFSAGIDKLGFSVGVMKTGLDELNLAYSGTHRLTIPPFCHDYELIYTGI